MYRLIIIITIVLSWATASKAQEITVYGNRSLWHAENLCDVQFTGCDYRSLDRGHILGYAYHPNGNLLLILDEAISDGQNQINIFNVEIENCKYNLLYSIPLPRYWTCANAANIDHLGAIYVNVNEYDSILSKSTRTISKIRNPAQPVIEKLFVYLPGQQIFDIHFSGDRVYIPGVNKEFIYVFDNDFNLLETKIMPKHIWGLTSVSYSCDSIITYATHLGVTSQEYFDGFNDSTMHISQYDLESNTLMAECTYWMGEEYNKTLLTSPLEFLSSDSECDLLIDLDRDNSTGVYPYDFLDSNAYCSKLEVPISDDDTYIHTSSPLDSIILTLSGIIDAGDEFLIMQPIPAGINFSMVNDSTYVIASTSSSDSLYTEALRSVFYQHNGTVHSEGLRTIIVQGFNAIKEGVKVKSYIQLEGFDETFLFTTTCMSSQAGEFVTTHLNQYGCDSLVTLTVSLIPADTTVISIKTCNADLTGNVENTFINQNGCDSLVITQTSLFPLPELEIEVKSDFNGFAISCFGESDGSITAQVTGIEPLAFFWSMGEANQTIMDLEAGSFEVTVTDGNGCTVSADVILSEPAKFSMGFVVSEPKCFDNQDGSITVEQTGGIEPIRYSIDGLNYQTSLTFNGLSGGTYQVSALDANDCEVKEIIWINVPLMLQVDLGDDMLILSGDTAVIQALTNVPFDSLASITWSGLINPDCANCLTQVATPIITTTYAVTITNHDGCSDQDSMTLLVEKDLDIYVPNIFSPNGDNSNDHLLISSGRDVEEISTFIIIDRWGELVFSASEFYPNDVNYAWDGKLNGRPLNSGVFAYRLVAEFKEGGSVVKYGDVTLIR